MTGIAVCHWHVQRGRDEGRCNGLLALQSGVARVQTNLPKRGVKVSPVRLELCLQVLEGHGRKSLLKISAAVLFAAHDTAGRRQSLLLQRHPTHRAIALSLRLVELELVLNVCRLQLVLPFRLHVLQPALVAAVASNRRLRLLFLDTKIFFGILIRLVPIILIDIHTYLFN